MVETSEKITKILRNKTVQKYLRKWREIQEKTGQKW